MTPPASRQRNRGPAQSVVCVLTSFTHSKWELPPCRDTSNGEGSHTCCFSFSVVSHARLVRKVFHLGLLPVPWIRTDGYVTFGTRRDPATLPMTGTENNLRREGKFLMLAMPQRESPPAWLQYFEPRAVFKLKTFT